MQQKTPVESGVTVITMNYMGNFFSSPREKTEAPVQHLEQNFSAAKNSTLKVKP